ncbi:MAG: plasmid partitioning protein RepB [Devosia sp.]
MARKNLLASVTGQPSSKVDGDSRADYTRRGASRSMMVSIDEMAENAKRMSAGETIVSLDPAIIDSSFVADRIDDDPSDFSVLLEAIREHGQNTPVLVRPHPTSAGRYMIVFGHRRTRVAKELGIPVKAIIKQLPDIAHVVAQGQENTARANLSFVEKALYARKLLIMGHEKATIRSALSLDETLLSRMLSVAETISPLIFEALGPCRAVGRDRWEELKKAVSDPKVSDQAERTVQTEEFRTTPVADQFGYLLQQLAKWRRKSPKAKTTVGTWMAQDETVKAVFSGSAKAFSLKLSAPRSGEFGRYLSENLEEFYDVFLASKNSDGE